MLVAMLAALLPDAARAVPQPDVRPAGIPAAFRQLSPCIPGMGEHWADPRVPRHGAVIYGTYRGKPVFTEIMLFPQDFARGRSFTDVLKPLPGYHIDHTDIVYLAHGHPGMPFPHYDLHSFYVPHAVSETFCRTSGARADTGKVPRMARAKAPHSPGPVAQR